MALSLALATLIIAGLTRNPPDVWEMPYTHGMTFAVALVKTTLNSYINVSINPLHNNLATNLCLQGVSNNAGSTRWQRNFDVAQSPIW